MLTDISNHLRVHNHNNHNNNNQLNVLRPLKIVDRKSSRKINDENLCYVKNNNQGIKNSNNNNNKMLEKPNYRFPIIYQEATDILFPYFNYVYKNDLKKKLKNNEIKIDYTPDENFFKNPIKKYSKPIDVNFKTQSNKIENNNLAIKKSNLFYGFNSNQDPIMDVFLHMKNENKLRFGDFMVTVNKDGTVQNEFSPESEEEEEEEQKNMLMMKRLSIIDNEEDEVLYQSDENEISRLENSDLDLTESEESDVDLDLELEIDDDDGFENNSIINSSLLSQGISNFNFENKLLTTVNNTNTNNNNISLSPLKRAIINSNINKISSSSPSPKKQEQLLFRTIKNKTSPIKTLKTQRSGINLSQINKPIKKNIKHTNYSKWDNSMTISAKAIMKMVDDSLVSSDTEIYNHSFSFMKNFSNNNNNNNNYNNNGSIFNNKFTNQGILKDDFSINENDLMNALNDVNETPLIERMQELKL